MEILWHVSQQTFGIKEAGNSFQHVSNSYFLKDEYYHLGNKWCYNNSITQIPNHY